MTFNDLTKELYIKDDLINNKLADELIFFLSKTVKDKPSLIANKNKEIDFDLNDYFYYRSEVFIKKTPIEYITKQTRFLGLTFNIDYGVFIPRNDTEFIVDWILESDFINDTNNVLDLCTGSGVIANTIKHYKPNLNVYGIDKSFKAIFTAKDNAKKYNLDVKFFWKNIFRLKKDFLLNFDLIICNPPYIDKNYPLEESVKKYEPKAALFAKDNGLEYYKRFVMEIYPNLANNCRIVFEIGFDQKEKLEEFLLSQNINDFMFLKDLNQNYRILYIQKK